MAIFVMYKVRCLLNKCSKFVYLQSIIFILFYFLLLTTHVDIDGFFFLSPRLSFKYLFIYFFFRAIFAVSYTFPLDKRKGKNAERNKHWKIEFRLLKKVACTTSSELPHHRYVIWNALSTMNTTLFVSLIWVLSYYHAGYNCSIPIITLV